MLIDAILKLHDQIQHGKLGSNEAAVVEERENAALRALPLIEDKGLLR
jgi:NADH-quinone oxidoreductase subunit B